MAPIFLPIYYITPFNYAIKGLAINEFMSPDYDTLYPGSTLTKGEVYLSTYGFPADNSWIINGIVILIAEQVVLIILQMLIVSLYRFNPYPYVFYILPVE